MNQPVRHFSLRHGLVALAVLAAFGPAFADEPPESEAQVRVGVGLASGDEADRAIAGQYSGLRDRNIYGLVGFDYAQRDNEGGTLLRISGDSLLSNSRELSVLWKRQGDWRFTANYSELIRRDPYTANTGLIGAGSTTPQVQYLTGGVGSGSTYNFETKRKGLGLGLSKWLFSDYEVTVDVKSENKDGARRFGIGIACPSTVAASCGATTASNTGYALLMLPEPINSNHTQVETRINYAGARLRLSGGYYGSFYRNSNTTLTASVSDPLNNPLGSPLPMAAGLQSILQQAIALSPDNEAHRFDLGGNYTFTPTTRANFKVAYTRALQDQSFSAFSPLPTGVSSLDGKVNTLLGQVGVTARPIPALTLTADTRYEDKNDKTPLAYYGIEGTSTFTNRDLSSTKWRSKLQAAYRFADSYVATVGVDQESIDRDTYTATSAARGISAWRQDTDELSWRAELRRQMGTDFSGSVAYIHSKRDGSIWQRPVSGTGLVDVPDTSVLGSNAIYMSTLADRKRDKLRFFGNWQALEALSLQFSVEAGKDEYTTPTSYALRDTKMRLYSVDANYVLSDEWKLNGYVSQSVQKLNQARPAGYVLAFDNKALNLGFGVTGTISEQLTIGGGLAFVNDRSKYDQTLDVSANANTAAVLAATGGLPDIVYRTGELKLFGTYALSETSSLRVDAIYQRVKYTDWGYTTFVYSDNTTLSLQQQQNAAYLGFIYSYAWR